MTNDIIDMEEWSYDYDHPYYGALCEYDERWVFETFKNGETDIWTPLINPMQYQKALNEFVQYGEFVRFPKMMVYQWMGIIMKNTAILRSCTAIAGHTMMFPRYEFIDVFFNDDEDSWKEWCDENLENPDYDYDSCSAYLDRLGFYDNGDGGFCVLPDGSDAWSDFGIKPIEELIAKYNSDMSAEEVIVLINKILDVYHQRGDLASMFIKGGSKTLSKITNGQLVLEAYNRMFTEKQTLNEDFFDNVKSHKKDIENVSDKPEGLNSEHWVYFEVCRLERTGKCFENVDGTFVLKLFGVINRFRNKFELFRNGGILIEDWNRSTLIKEKIVISDVNPSDEFHTIQFKIGINPSLFAKQYDIVRFKRQVIEVCTIIHKIVEEYMESNRYSIRISVDDFDAEYDVSTIETGYDETWGKVEWGTMYSLIFGVERDNDSLDKDVPRCQMEYSKEFHRISDDTKVEFDELARSKKLHIVYVRADGEFVFEDTNEDGSVNIPIGIVLSCFVTGGFVILSLNYMSCATPDFGSRIFCGIEYGCVNHEMFSGGDGKDGWYVGYSQTHMAWDYMREHNLGAPLNEKTIANISDDKHCPLLNAVWRYHTFGTSAGDWFVPRNVSDIFGTYGNSNISKINEARESLGLKPIPTDKGYSYIIMNHSDSPDKFTRYVPNVERSYPISKNPKDRNPYDDDEKIQSASFACMYMLYPKRYGRDKH